MLLRRETLVGLSSGKISLVFRRWDRARVKAGTRLRTAVGVILVEEVRRVAPARISAADARRAGYASRAALLGDLARFGSGPVHRIRLRHVGADPRAALRKRARLTAEERVELEARLARLDRASRHGPWTRRVLERIHAHPGRRAAELAPALGLELQRFKAHVRQLKELGLTESLEVGYRLSPRGRAAWHRLARRPS